ncbi:MAG: acyltransferase [Prevotella sp.]|jgi:peptidoglycan/LPS O-acetylase OafA/YrhL|nr:acyltransferase [Prevotella sp.]
MRLQIIDFLRGYSIFTIVVFHLFQRYDFPNILEKAINFGGAGVHIFILCSGFGLCLSQLNKPLNFIEFLKKRFLKIYIPYIIIILISFFIPFLCIDSDRLVALLSHIFLFKMFDEHLISSFGGQFWFVSMIIQFYLFFIFLFKISERMNGWKFMMLSLFISLTWSTLVGLIGKEEERIWNSFFLQYLWEFSLGLVIAKAYFKGKFKIQKPKLWHLIVISILSLAIFGFMGIKGGIFKLYNDVPSLIAYLSLALLIYYLSVKWINKFFIYTNTFSYEWFLVHMLIISCVLHYFKDLFPLVVSASLAFMLSYITAIGYHKLLKKTLYSHIS